MLPPLEKLLKFLKLEAERNYDNRAVVGGLDKIIPIWLSEARKYNLPEDYLQGVLETLNSYPAYAIDDRQAALVNLHQLTANLPENEAIKSASMQNPSSRDDSKNQSSPIIKNRAEPATVSPPVRKPEQISEALSANLTVLSGIGPKTASTLKKLGLETLEDLLYYFPRRYDDYSQLKPINRLRLGDEVSIIASIQSVNNRLVRNGKMRITEAIVTDGTGALRVSWFNQPWLEKSLKAGLQLVLSGKVEIYLGRLVMNSPDWEMLDQDHLHTTRIVPVYPLTAQVTQKNLRRLMHQTVNFWAPRVTDFMPAIVIREGDLLPLPEALLQIHFPDTAEKLRLARHRLAFDEIFLMQLGVLRQKRLWQSNTAEKYPVEDEWLNQQFNRLPYPLTGAQLRVIDEIRRDLNSGIPMNRLLQGDVGSGKTIVAAIGMQMVTSHGAQTAIMAPTSILAEQHFQSLKRLLVNFDDDNKNCTSLEQIRLLVGDTSESDKAEIRAGLADGTIKIVVGTHALIEEKIEFQRLQMTVIDEQHRFGVEQRAALRLKGENPHLLVMTATPIPRSLALTVYGDLDVSVMDEMPAGRIPVETHVIHPLERERAYQFVHSQLETGHQAFIVYPLVEKGDKDETLTAVEEQRRLQDEIFRNYKVGLLHGRMRPEQKDQVMDEFRRGLYHILVSTSVIEVGVDIPNATVMLIEGANRFGLAQLHQFRGRVGRGPDKSYCLLIPDTDNAIENERLSVMVETTDGFILAERDLEQRGPGDFLGTRQSGFHDLKMVTLMDIRLIEKARNLAHKLFEYDPDLSNQSNSRLLSTLNHFWRNGRGDIS